MTPRDNLRLPSPTELVDCGLQEEYEDVKGVESEGEFEYKHVCWACGWTETVTISITRD